MSETTAKVILTRFTEGEDVSSLAVLFRDIAMLDLEDVLRWGLVRARASRNHQRQPTWGEYRRRKA